MPIVKRLWLKAEGQGYSPTFVGIFKLLRPGTGVLRGFEQIARALTMTGAPSGKLRQVYHRDDFEAMAGDFKLETLDFQKDRAGI